MEYSVKGINQAFCVDLLRLEYGRPEQRYAHLAPETLLAASNAATKAVGSIMGVMPNRIVDVPLVAAQG
jgi:hypothetical protein